MSRAAPGTVSKSWQRNRQTGITPNYHADSVGSTTALRWISAANLVGQLDPHCPHPL